MYLQYQVRKYANAAKMQITGAKSRGVKIAETLVSNLFFVIFLLSLIVIMTAIMGALNAVYFVTGQSILIAGYIVAIVMSSIFITIIVIAGLIDFILDVKEHGFWTGFLTSRDPLNYRVDFLWILVCTLGAIVFLVMVLAVPSNNVVINWLALIPEFFFRGGMMMAGSVMCLIVLARRKILQFLKKKENRELGLSKTEKLMRVLCDEKMKIEFEKYCNAEFSTENILAYNELIRFLDCTTRREKLILLQGIYDTFVQQNSVNEVNLPEHVRQNLKQVLEHVDSLSEGQDINVLAEKLMQEIKQNLTDTFSRFMYTEAYLKYTRRSSFARMMNDSEFIDPTLRVVPRYMEESQKQEQKPTQNLKPDQIV
jgi:hypothetical protein